MLAEEHHSDRPPLAIDALADEFAQKCRQGSCPSITQYVEDHPHLAHEINEIFPAIAMMEQLSRSEEAVRADSRHLFRIENQLLDRLGDFRIVREIGRGGMGIVYEAIQESLGRRVALKVLTANVARIPRQLERFQREAQAAAMLHHTNIVPIFGVGQDDGFHYYVMQYIDGIGLDKAIDHQRQTHRQYNHDADAPTCVLRHPEEKHGPFFHDGCPRVGEAEKQTILSKEPPANPLMVVEPHVDQTTKMASRPFAPPTPLTWPQITDYGIQIARAVDYAHQKGILHRDIKPANLLVDAQSTVWVTDFGLAKVFGDDGLTQTGDMCGTTRYMAPEQFEGRSTHLTDIYSIGVTLYELATSEPAFPERDAKQLILRITQQGIPRPRMVDRAIPKDLETIILKAAAFDPRHRYATAGQLADDLQRFRNGEPIAARRTSPIRRLWRWSCRNPALAALSSLSIVLLLLVAIVASVGWLHVEKARRQAIQLALRERRQARQLRAANERVRAESNRAREESQRAEDNLQLAMHAFEDVIQHVSTRGLPESLDLEIDIENEGNPRALVTDDDAEMLQSLLSFYEEFAQRNHANTNIRFETAKAHQRIGDIRKRLGQFNQALAAYGEALDIYERIAAKRPNDTPILLAITEVLNQRGVAFARTGNLRESVLAHTTARDLLRDRLDTLASRSDHDSVQPSNEPAPCSKEPIAESAPSTDLDDDNRESEACRFALAKTYNYLGSIWSHTSVASIPPASGGPPWQRPASGPPWQLQPTPSRSTGPWHFNALEQMEVANYSALQLLEELLANDTDNTRYRLALARCYRNRLSLLRHGASADDVAQCLATSLEILEQLVVDHPNNAHLSFELADVLSIDTPALRNTEFGKQARTRLEQAEKIAHELSHSYPGQPEYQTLYANALYRLGLVLHRKGHKEHAIRHLTESFKHYEKLQQRFPAMPTYVVALGQVADDLGTIQREAGYLEASRQTLDKAITQLRASQNETQADTRFARRLTAVLQRNLGWTLDALEQHHAGPPPRRGRPFPPILTSINRKVPRRGSPGPR